MSEWGNSKELEAIKMPEWKIDEEASKIPQLKSSVGGWHFPTLPMEKASCLKGRMCLVFTGAATIFGLVLAMLALLSDVGLLPTYEEPATDAEPLQKPFSGAINGNWSGYSIWSGCSKTCGEGQKTRIRTCTNPPPQLGGRQCQGTDRQVQTCLITEQCPVHGGWSSWGGCTKTCRGGVQTRKCSNPAPEFFGDYCLGESSRKCNENIDCAISGNWSGYSIWSECSKTCGEGQKSRSRTCTNPPPQFGGRQCQGTDRQVQTCLISEKCPVHGGWSSWGSCTKSCRGGVQTRKCTNPAPAFWGDDCSGESSRKCNEQIDCGYSGECIFPFEHNQVTYNGCTTVGNDNVFWCATSPKDKDGYSTWKNCKDSDPREKEIDVSSNLEPLQQPLSPAINENSSGYSGGCIFPFEYNQVTYKGCTTVGNDNIFWCITSPRDKDGLFSWKNCEDKDPKDEDPED